MPFIKVNPKISIRTNRPSNEGTCKRWVLVTSLSSVKKRCFCLRTESILNSPKFYFIYIGENMLSVNYYLWIVFYILFWTHMKNWEDGEENINILKMKLPNFSDILTGFNSHNSEVRQQPRPPPQHLTSPGPSRETSLKRVTRGRAGEKLQQHSAVRADLCLGYTVQSTLLHRCSLHQASCAAQRLPYPPAAATTLPHNSHSL